MALLPPERPTLSLCGLRVIGGRATTTGQIAVGPIKLTIAVVRGEPCPERFIRAAEIAA